MKAKKEKPKTITARQMYDQMLLDDDQSTSTEMMIAFAKQKAFKNLKQRLKTAKECFISSIETVLYYQSEIKLQLKVFRVNAKNINRF